MINQVLGFLLLAVGVSSAMWAMHHNPWKEQTERLNTTTYFISLALTAVGIVGGGLLSIS